LKYSNIQYLCFARRIKTLKKKRNVVQSQGRKLGPEVKGQDLGDQSISDPGMEMNLPVSQMFLIVLKGK
jgi:hypothetical protein